MINIKHIFFDLDHTLWDFDKNSELAFLKIFKMHSFSVAFSEFIEVYMKINKEYWALYNHEKVTKEALRYGRLKDTFDAINLKVSDQLIHQISDDYSFFLSQNTHLIEGAIQILEYLKPKYKIHLITNGFEKVQLQKIKVAKIDAFFDVVVTSECLGVKKPNPKVFEFALDKVGAEPSQCVMIGDNYQADVLGAHNVGMKPIYFKNNSADLSNDFISVDNLLEIKQYL